MRGEISTAAEGETLKVVARGIDKLLPGHVLVVEGLEIPLLSFHGMEAGGYTYTRHPRDSRLRCWKKEGKTIPNLTFCVYPNNIALWHRDGYAYEYPQHFPETPGAYRAVEGVPVHHAPTEKPGSPRTLKSDSKGVQFSAETTVISRTATTRRHPPAGRGTPRQPRARQKTRQQPPANTTAEPPHRHSHPDNHIMDVESRNGYAELEVDEGGDDEEGEENAHKGGAAHRASKLWTTVHAGDGRFNVMLMHAATHMGEKRMIRVIEDELLLNPPTTLTTRAIRAHFPTQCLPCRTGKAKKVNRDRKRVGNATTLCVLCTGSFVRCLAISC
jgi:hypothetical protein